MSPSPDSRPDETLTQLLADCAARGTRPALRGVDDTPALSHAALAEAVAEAREVLAGAGIGRDDVVLFALPDGPMALVGILALAATAVALPVPARDQGTPFADIAALCDVSAVMCEARPTPQLAAFADARGLTVIRVSPRPGAAAGLFDCQVDRPRTARPTNEPEPQDVAFIAATAGSTAAPKLVVVSHAALVAQYRCFAERMGLGEQDRSLCMMPVAHLHSLVRSSLPVLHAGGEVAWAPGFDRRRAPGWIDSLQPSLMTGVPSIFRALSERQDWRPASPVRLIALGSDAVTEADIEAIGRRFGARVAQFYGMTETAPMIATTGPGSVDPSLRVAAPWSVAILDENGAPVPDGVSGEIAARGGIVNPTIGPDGTVRARIDAAGWLRTGDAGRVGPDGTLVVEGRLDDRITRGGVKIAPQAVEAALATHPAIAVAVAYRQPHPVLGQVVAVAVVTVPGRQITADDVRAHAALTLKSHLVPASVRVVEAIPLSETGKISRRHIAGVLSDRSAGDALAEAPEAEGETEAVLALLRRALETPELGPDDEFFASGGDSLTALEVLIDIETAFGVSLSPAEFTVAGSARRIAAAIASARGERGVVTVATVREGHRAPLLIVAHGVNGDAGYAPTLAGYLDDGQPVASLHARSQAVADLPVRSLRELALVHADEIERRQPGTPIAVAGFSLGAHVATAIADVWTTRGRIAPLIVVLDDSADLEKRLFGAADLVRRDTHRLRYKGLLDATAVRPLPAHLVYFRAGENAAEYASDPTSGWGEIATGGVTVVDIPDNHSGMSQQAALTAIGPRLQAELGRDRPPAPAPDAMRMLRHEARQAARDGRAEDELAFLLQAIDEDPDQPSWLYGQLALARLAREERADAVAAYHQAVSRSAWPLLVDFQLVREMRDAGLNDIVEAAQRRVVTLRPDHPSVHAQVARFWRIFDQTGPMLDAVEAGLAEAPRHLSLRMLHMDAMRRLDNWDSVLETGRALQADFPHEPGFLALMAEAMIHRGEAGAAVAFLTQALETWPEHPKLRIKHTRALLAAGRIAEAEASARQTLAAAPHSRAAQALHQRVVDRLARDTRATRDGNRAKRLRRSRKSAH